ncbi:pectinesterase inhibitor domain-containing protein [Artemisia annua]|uniref:Pectinesterase inhibitor domain-containing protein n=1 Tax=Artemisia annua TaxID=35608 RepID=A0A2U1Q794_ARTAN|nr:pectinesterase inhibitor domain-containing protein [Artemisia annua]
MEKLVFYLLVLVVTLPYTTVSGATPSNSMNFIKASCRTTLHPTLCVNCLSSYAGSIQGSDHQLAKAAITVSFKNTKSAFVFLSKMARVSGIKPREYQAVKDCISTITNSVTSLSQSVQELEKMAQTSGQDFEWHMSNVETWVGSALTNQNMCSRGFAGDSLNGRVKDSITKRIEYVCQVTSNALALVNRFAVRHRKGIHKP